MLLFKKAPRYNIEHSKKGSYGYCDYYVLSDLLRFAYLPNFTGLPAITIPIGFIDDLPVGLQVISKWYDETTLLKFALLADKFTQKKKPKVFVDVLRHIDTNK